MKAVMAVMIFGSFFYLAGCSGSTPDGSADDTFVALAERFVQAYLELYPEQATLLGDHRYDHRLNDYSEEGVRAAVDFNRRTLDELRGIDAGRLNDTNRVDYLILRNHLEGELFALRELREHVWNPLTYNVGGAIYYLIARDFAPIEDRMKNVIERLKQVREVTAFAKANLKDAPKVHIETAIQQNQGTIGLIENELTPFIEQVPHLQADFDEAREMAVDALTYYGNWLERDLLPASDGDFRIGAELFRKKLAFVLDSNFTMEEIFARAETELKATQDALFETARPLYREYTGKEPKGDRKQVIKLVLDRLADSRPTNETIVELARESVEECRRFTEAKQLVTVPDEPINLIVMPEFQRGVAVAYCDAPGPLEPAGKTFYAISPTPEGWDAGRVESFFREYNDYMLQDLTIHEAIPGHYLQLAHANKFKAPTLIRSMFYSGTFVEGWATYAEQLMAETGFGGPEVQMQQLKMRLRLVINAIIDQKIHTAGMTEAEAVGLMTNEGFQEEGEAAGKWRRACLTSTQLSTYFVGNMEINDLRQSYEAKNGPGSMLDMHDQMLAYGSPPAKYVKQLLGLER